MKPNLGISDNHLQLVAQELNKLLADEVVLYIQARNYHWNIEGSNFYEMHQLFEKQFTEIDGILDDVAERIRIIGHYTEARLTDYLALTNLIEPAYTNESRKQLEQLIFSHETIIRSLRRLITLFADEYKDAGTSDFVTRLLSQHEKMAWLARANLVDASS